MRVNFVAKANIFEPIERVCDPFIPMIEKMNLRVRIIRNFERNHRFVCDWALYELILFNFI